MILKHKKIIMALSLLLMAQSAFPCTRFTYTGANNEVIVGRSMDWIDDLKTDLWAFPFGISRTGVAGDNSVKWVSKYGSVVSSFYNSGSADGMNEKGLSANLLYLSGSDYGIPSKEKQNLSILQWVQYMLDNYATVDEAVKDFGQDKFNIIAPKSVNGHAPDVHVAISDSSGDNAVFEYVNGKLVTHHGKQYTVMTNEPTYDKQLALNDYWQNMKGKFLPGTESPEDRFVRTSYYLSEANKNINNKLALATTFSIIRNVSVPMGKVSLERPNLCPTIWRTAADLKNKFYYFEEAEKPNVFWVDLNKIDFSRKGGIKKLSLANGEVYAGEVSSQFKSAKPFTVPEVTSRK